jgi:hypothetical protein
MTEELTMVLVRFLYVVIGVIVFWVLVNVTTLIIAICEWWRIK